MREEKKLFLFITPPFAPELTERMIEVLSLARKVIESGVDMTGIVRVEKEQAGRLMALYDFDKFQPTEWEGMKIWASETLPEETFFLRYGEEAYILSAQHIFPRGPATRVEEK